VDYINGECRFGRILSECRSPSQRHLIDESGHPPKMRKIKNVADVTHNA
jgi:hypothetical protein